MVLEGYSKKGSLVLVYTGDGKGKTSAALGLMIRALGAGKRVAFFQFIKDWSVSEHKFIESIQDIYKDKLYFLKDGRGFYGAGELSSGATDDEHKLAARRLYDQVKKAASGGDYDLVICDEINNAVSDGLLDVASLEKIIDSKHQITSLCLTGRNFPKNLNGKADIITEMKKVKHCFDQKVLALEGIDY